MSLCYGYLGGQLIAITSEKVTAILLKENNIANAINKNSLWQQDYNKAEQAQKEATLTRKIKLIAIK